MDSEFKILPAYVRERRLHEKDEDEEEEEEEEEEEQFGEEKQCQHLDHVLHEGRYVCSSCGLVMAVIYFTEDDVHRRCSLMKKSYAVHERLSGVDRHLLHFLSKTELLSDQLCVHTLREQILAMKKSSLYKSINYAIALSCIVYDTNVDVLRKLRSYLPRSNVSWLRFSRIMKPLPQHFPLLYVLRLMESTRMVSSSQLSTLRTNLLILSPSDTSLMVSLIDAYCWETYSLDHVIQNLHTFDSDLISILYQFTKVAVSCKESLR